MWPDTWSCPAPSPRRLLLARHGRTEWNSRRVWQGHADIPLDDVGHEEARRLAAALADQSFACVVTSDLARAHATAEAVVAARPARLIVDPRLREIDVGTWEGMTTAEIAAKLPDVAARLARGEDLPRGGAETLEDLRTRCRAGLHDAFRAADGGDLLLVVHGGVIKMLVVELLGMPTANVSRLNTGGNTCVTEFSFSAGPPRLVRFADASHLD